MRASSPAHCRTENSRSDLTRVELTWLEKRIEHWIRFGRTAEETIVNRRRRVVSFAPGAVFAFVRWAANDFGTVVSRIDTARAVTAGEYFRPCRSYVPAARFFCASMAGPRSTTFCGRSTPSKPAGSIQLTSRPTIGGTSTSARPPASSRDRIRSRGTKRGSCAGARNDRPRPNPRDHAHRRLSDGLARARRRPPWLIWNASASVPIGLYAIHTVGAQRIGGLVVVKPPEPLASFLADRGYLPRGVPLVKHVAALPDSRSVATGSQSALAPSRSAKRASATAAAVRCPSGRAAASSPRAKSSS